MQVTVDLDVMVRDELLTFLRNDSIARGATIICESEVLYFFSINQIFTQTQRIFLTDSIHSLLTSPTCASVPSPQNPLRGHQALPTVL